MEPVTVVAGLLMLTGIVGLIVPVLPGLLLTEAGVLLWATENGSRTAWVVFGASVVVALVGWYLQYQVPNRTLRRIWVPGRSHLAGVVLALGPARWGLVLVVVLAAVGTTALACSPAAGSRAEPGADRRSLLGPVRRPGMARLLATMACFGACSALVVTGVAAAADRIGHPAWAGAVEAGIATGSVTGGLLWAARRRLLPGVPALLGGFAVLLVAASVLPFWAAAVVLAVGGLAWAPTFVEAFQAADRLAPEAERTEASTLVNTATNLASAGGTALTGGLVAAGVSPYLPAAGLAVAAVLLASRGR